MSNQFRRLPAIAALLLLLAVWPLTALASQSPASTSCKTPRAHHLPSASGSTSRVTVFAFGVQGGSLRPWSVKLSLDGSVTGSGVTVGNPRLTSPKATLQGLLALADAEGFFSIHAIHGDVGCSGTMVGPDTSAQFISIHTSAGSKRLNVLGSCMSKFNQLYGVLRATAAVG
jgi:hypothetical protein